MNALGSTQSVAQVHAPSGLKIPVLAVVGVGLIGGSFAAALRRAGAVGRVLGAGRRVETLALARELGISRPTVYRYMKELKL